MITGIVADSVADNEWLETLNKARAVIRAAELAQARFGTLTE
ncbi:MAG: anthranilate synthase component [Pseudomonadota bacterium]|nr:anthranilate synthase component [Pseudomonadota bacterium]